MPPAVAGRLNDELIKILKDPEVRARILATGNEPVGLGLAAFGAQMTEEHAGYVRMIKAADIKPQ